MNDKVHIEGLELYCIIGIFDWERKTKQKVRIDITLTCDISKAAKTENIEDAVDYKKIAKSVIAMVAPSSFQLVETMAEKISELCLDSEGVIETDVKVSKPGAVRHSENVAVSITRPSKLSPKKFYLGVGGNIEPEKNIKLAMELIKERFTVLKTSSVYRSKAWGVKEEQPDYLNLAVECETNRDLFGLRAEIRWIEELLGRKRTLDKFAPRTADIDLLLYGEMVIEDEGGKLPHPQLTTQQFVYYPMKEIAPDVFIPGANKNLSDIKPEYEDKNLLCEKVPSI